MKKENIDYFIKQYQKCFPENGLISIRKHLESSRLTDAELIWNETKIKYGYKNPTIGLVLSILLVPFDRVYVGDFGLAGLKFITACGFGIWTIVDWFLIPKRCREINMNNFLSHLANCEYEANQAEQNAHIMDLKLKRMELQMQLATERDKHIQQYGYDSHAAEIDNALNASFAMEEQEENEREYRRIEKERHNETLAAIERQNELIAESNKIAKDHAREEEFWNIMRYTK